MVWECHSMSKATFSNHSLQPARWIWNRLRAFDCLGIIEQHHGKIVAIRIMGLGTRFDVNLPKVAVGKRPIARVEESSNVKLFNREAIPLKFLLVDDESFLRDSNSQLLSALGHDVAISRMGKLRSTYCDAIRTMILSYWIWTMPVMSGNEAIKLIKAEFSKRSSYQCSGYASETSCLRFRCDSVKPDGFLEKPFTMASLAKILDECAGF